jgi:hypothetical protein
MHILRPACLAGRPILLLGHLPHPGRALVDVFRLPAVDHAGARLTDEDLRVGTVAVSTSPSLGPDSMRQLEALKNACRRDLPFARVVHVSHDMDSSAAIDGSVHGELYTLEGASESSCVSFTWAFGVGVLGEKQIAHGLFALREGIFVAAETPFDQRPLHDVSGFIRAWHASFEEERAPL